MPFLHERVARKLRFDLKEHSTWILRPSNKEQYTSVTLFHQLLSLT